MSNDNTRQMIKAAWFTPRANGRWGLPMLGESDPGVGKSSITEYDAKSCGLKPITLIGSLRPPEDFLGFPKIAKGGDSFEYVPPAWVKEANEAEAAVVFFDEFTAGQSARTFSAMLRIILEGVVGEHKLNPRVRFIGMCNPADQSPGGQELPLPLANRFGHFQFPVPQLDNWVTYLMSSASSGVEPEVQLDPASEEARVMKDWENAFSWAVGIFAGAMRSSQELLHNVPKADHEQATKGWPSPRSNEFAIRALASSRIHRLNDETMQDFIEAFIGGPAAGTILHFLRSSDMPDAIDVLDGKVEWKHDARKLDVTYSLLTTMTRLATMGKDGHDMDVWAENYWKAVSPIVKDSADLMVLHVEAIFKSKVKALRTNAEGRKALLALAPMLRAAGVSRK